MALQRCLLELGTGVDLHGMDSTKAARRAVFDALRHASVSFPRVFGYTPHMMSVDVKIAVPYPETVKPDDVLQELPYGTKTISVVEGGLEIAGAGDNADSTIMANADSTIMANAAITVSLDIPE